MTLLEGRGEEGCELVGSGKSLLSTNESSLHSGQHCQHIKEIVLNNLALFDHH